MKTRILLCMMLLGLLTTSAQPQMPRILDNGFRLMPTPHQFTVKNDSYENCFIQDISNPRKGGGTDPTIDPNAPKIDFVLDFDTNTQRATTITLINKTSSYTNSSLGTYQLQQGSNVLNVPCGTYDIVVLFETIDKSFGFVLPLNKMYIIREQVAISEDMTMNFAASEAKNHIHFQTLTIDGEPVYTGKGTYDENWNYTELEPGNVDDVFYITCLVCNDNGLLFGNEGNFGNYNQSASEELADIYINDVSERYTLSTYRVAFRNKGHEFYTSYCEIGGASENISVCNDPSKFELFQDPFLVSQHQGEQLYPEISFAVLPKNDQKNYRGTTTTFTSPLADGEQIKSYISASPDESNSLIPLFEPTVSIKTTTIDPWGDEYESFVPVLTSIPLTRTENHTVFANNGGGSWFLTYVQKWTHFESEYSEELNEYGWDIIDFPIKWPSHPVFTYPVEKMKGVLGNNCPIMISNARQINNIFTFDYDYIGRYGEKHPDDIKSKFGNPDDPTNSEFTIKVNGENYGIGHGFTWYELEAPLDGEVDITVINEAVIVDDLAGSNMAQLHYTAGAEDESAPTMTMLHFKGFNEDVTDRFANACEGKLEFSAGDFNYKRSPLNFDYFARQAPELVEVSYSPYGEDNWNELPVEEVPENYWPVMGWFYTGSLAGVTGQGLNGWFDLKIRLTDAAGNWQEQVLSPAFRIDDHAYSSVATLRDNNAHEVARYNLAGQRVDTDATGIFIIRMSDGTARKVLVP